MRSLSLLLFAVLLSSCTIFQPTTQVTFVNNTSFILANIKLGSLTVGSSLTPSTQTGVYSITPGQSVLTAESQNGTWTNEVLLSIAAGHSYTITFSGSKFETMTASMTATN